MEKFSVRDQEHLAPHARYSVFITHSRDLKRPGGPETTHTKPASPRQGCVEHTLAQTQAGSLLWWCPPHLVLVYVEPAQLLQLLCMEGSRSTGTPRQRSQARRPHPAGGLALLCK